MGGKFIVIDGVDGSGKGTQTQLLIKKLENKGYNVLKGDFPRYGKRSAMLVEDYLNGRLGTIEEIDAYQASVLYAVDRFVAAKEMRAHLTQGGIIISNRYATSNQIHQSTKIQDEKDLEQFLLWVEDFEYNVLKIPRPDKVLFLNMHYLIGQELVGKKDLRKYLEKGETHDLHEKDTEHLRKAYERACSLVRRYDNWQEIKCFEKDKPRSIKDIHEEILQVVEKILEE